MPTKTTKPATDKVETKTVSKSQQLQLELVPVPADAEIKVIELLFALAMSGNISAAKLFLDYCHSDPDDEPDFTIEDAMKFIQEQLKTKN